MDTYHADEVYVEFKLKYLMVDVIWEIVTLVFFFF